MKFRTLFALLAIWIFSTFSAAAQKKIPLNEPNLNKPKRFADVPERAPLRLGELAGLLTLPVGARVSSTLADNFVLRGHVVSTSDPSDKSVQSVVIRSTNRPGALFTFTQIREADGSYSYLGRMIDRGAGDAIEITREGKQYVFKKRSLNEMITE